MPHKAAIWIINRISTSLKDDVPILSILGLLDQELNRSKACSKTIIKNDPIIFCMGIRLFICRPLYYSDNKLAKNFTGSESSILSSIYGPLSNQPLPLLVFKLPENKKPHQLVNFVANGSLEAFNSDRTIL